MTCALLRDHGLGFGGSKLGGQGLCMAGVIGYKLSRVAMIRIAVRVFRMELLITSPGCPGCFVLILGYFGVCWPLYFGLP